MALFKRKEDYHPTQQQAAPAYQQPRQSVSFGVPVSEAIKLRAIILFLMFFLGMISQFLLAIYIPKVWNFIYGVLQNFLPVL